MLERLCQVTGLPGEDRQEVDITIRVTRPEEYEVRRRPWYPGSGWSDYRAPVGRSFLDALAEACMAEWKKDEQPAR